MEKTIYIAESDRVQREELALKLGENPAFRVIGQTENGVVAKDEIKKLKPDVVLLSLALPGLDGFGVIEKIREKCDIILDIENLVLSAGSIYETKEEE